LTREHYDAVLVDIEMPRLDGFSLVERMRGDPRLRHTPAIMLTGHEDIVSIDRAYQAGATSFVTKPVNWRQLSYHIRYVVRTSRPQGPRPGSHEPVGKSDSETTPAADHDVREFLKSVVRRADAIEGNLAVHDRERWSGPLQGVRTVVTRAFAELRAAPVFHSGMNSQFGSSFESSSEIG